MVRAFLEAEKLRVKEHNRRAHLEGMYFYDALKVTMYNAFAEKGKPRQDYPKTPYVLDSNFQTEEEKQQEKENKEEKEMRLARAYMMQMDAAGKQWGAPKN